MSSLKFKQLQILSHTQKSGNLFKFKEGLNLITALDNSVGKSTLAKLLYWGVGCDPVLDSKWKALECKTIVDFEIDGQAYRVMRSGNAVTFKHGDSDSIKFNKISGAYAEMISGVLGFHALLPNQKTKVLEVPPPAYYFLPFYIDQKKGWGSPWDSFDNLRQYSSWKESVIKYHVGILSPEYFENERLISENKISQKGIAQEVVKLNNALEIVLPYVNSYVATINKEELDELSKEIENDLKELADSQESILDRLSKAETDRANISHQAIMARAAVSALDKDYVFAVENVPSGTFFCPLCGTEHNNSVINRSLILADKEEAISQLNTIEALQAASDIGVKRLRYKLEGVRQEISLLNEKYIIEEDNRKVELSEIVNTIAAKSMQTDVFANKGSKEQEISSLKVKMKALTQSKKDLIDKDKANDVNSYFLERLALFVQIIDAKAVDLTLVKSPIGYNSIFKEGGAAEGARSILAYYLAIYSTISKFGNEVVAPIVIDTPNQQEQSAANYVKIVELITQNLPTDSQVIICALDRDAIQPIKDKAYVISLDESLLMNERMYGKVISDFVQLGDTILG